jgi:hypothetical protein
VLSPQQVQHVRFDAGELKALGVGEHTSPRIVRVQVLDGRDETQGGCMGSQQLVMRRKLAEEGAVRKTRKQG